MKVNKLRDVEDLFCLAGGYKYIAAYLDLHQNSVERWHRIGISERYWARLADKYNVLPIDLYTISQKAKRSGKR